MKLLFPAIVVQLPIVRPYYLENLSNFFLVEPRVLSVISEGSYTTIFVYKLTKIPVVFSIWSLFCLLFHKFVFGGRPSIC